METVPEEVGIGNVLDFLSEGHASPMAKIGGLPSWNAMS